MRANNQKSTMPGLMLGLILVLFIFHVLSPAAAQAASASAIETGMRVDNASSIVTMKMPMASLNLCGRCSPFG